MKRSKILVFALSILSVGVLAQDERDSVRLLKPVTITQNRLSDYVIGGYKLPVDSTMLALGANGSLTEMLRKQGLGHIRSYGPGGVATPSFRGTGSSHTAVLWNGINLVSPLLGQLDLTLVPAGLFDNATIQTGGSTSLSGNGSIGANIHLNNDIAFNRGLSLKNTSSVGSFSSLFQDLEIAYSNKRFGTSTKLFLSHADNDFKFTDNSTFDPQIRRRKHNRFQQQGFLHQFHLVPAKNHIISLKLWYQDSDLQVPNIASNQDGARATEANSILRILAGWNYFKGNFDLNYKGAYIIHDLHYVDPIVSVDSRNSFNSLIQNIEGNVVFTEQSQLTSGIHFTHESGTAEGFGSKSPMRDRAAVFTAFKFESGVRWKFAVSAREELVNGTTTPIAPTLSATFNAGKVEMFGNASRNYRLPTFNDLYWSGAGARGNAQLEPELSLGGEIGSRIQTGKFLLRAVVFNNYVDDWILWSPTQSQIWTPHNVKKVWARGLESQARVNGRFRKIGYSLSGLYSYTRSTNQAIYENGNPNELDKQLIYTPIHEASAMAHAEWRCYWFRLVYAVTGEQFTDADNTGYNKLPLYAITTFYAGRQLTLKSKLQIIINLEVNNIFDVDYRVRSGYPMPGINYKASIQLKFNKLNKHE